jgi:hypothetical protein
MSSIQGIQGGGAVTAAYAVAPKPQAALAQAAKSEARESAQTERAEAARGAQESGERQGTNASIGSKLSITA